MIGFTRLQPWYCKWFNNFKLYLHGSIIVQNTCFATRIGFSRCMGQFEDCFSWGYELIWVPYCPIVYYSHGTNIHHVPHDFAIWGFLKIGVSPNHPLYFRVFHAINHLFWGTPPPLWKTPYQAICIDTWIFYLLYNISIHLL